MTALNQDSFSTYQLLESLHVGRNSLVYRAQKPGEDSVILKVLNTDYPSAIQTARFQHEFNIMKSLDWATIPKAYDWVQEGNQVGIVLQDIGARGSVEQLNFDANELGLVLDIAVQVAEALLVLNKAQIVHKDIKPHNVVCNPNTGLAQLIDYGLATELSSEEKFLTGHEDLVGTLPYIAPEQTGRMNSTVDYRTDFYAFGVLLYELFSGEKPFSANDAIGWVHCHVAKTPLSWQDKHPELPKMLEVIVIKLLSKKKEDRYQNAAVLLQDLKECKRQWQEKNHIEPFEIAKNDIPSHFQVSQQLYGRDEELNILLNAFDRVAEGQAGELILVAGYSGIGKSALVREVHKPLVAKRGYFIEGKFDQFKANIPFSAMAQALGDLMQQLLKQPKDKLDIWKEDILTALEGQGKIIIDIVPELALVIGEQAEVEALGGLERLNRLNYMLERFIDVFTTPDHPLVLFLDDLQWVDAASLSLLQSIMQREDNRYLLLIGAYRDNEVDGAHPLMKTVEDLNKAKVIVHTLTLPPLVPKAITNLVADTLYADTQQVKGLAALLHKQTGGNPFFLNQFLKMLHQKEWIRFDHDAIGWYWDLQQIENQGFTDNVAEIMLDKLQGLPEATQLLLGLAACIGHKFDLAVLSIIAKQQPVEVVRNLWIALELEILLGEGDLLKLIKNMPIETAMDNIASSQMRFLHDRIQQAAYQLIAEDQQAIVHRDTGHLLLAYYTNEQQQAHCFDLANHLNKGRDLIEDEEELLTLIQLNLTCGQQALSSTAYSSAVDYLQLACKLLPEIAWQTQPELTFAVYLELSRALYLSTDHEQAELVFEMLLTNTKMPEQRLQIHIVQMEHYNLWGKFEQAIEVGKQALLLQSIVLPDSQEMLESLLQDELKLAADYRKHHDINEIKSLPEMTSPDANYLMMVLNELIVPSYVLGNITLFAWGAVKMANTSLTFGHHRSSGIAFVQYGFVLVNINGEFEQGVSFGKLGVAIAKQTGQAYSLGNAMFLNSVFMAWHKEPLSNVIKVFEEAHQLCRSSGQLVWAGYAATFIIYHSLEYSLDEAYLQTKKITPVIRRSSPQVFEDLHIKDLWFIAEFSDASLSEFDLPFDQQEFINRYQNAIALIAAYYDVKIMSLYLSRQYLDSEDLISKMEQVERGMAGHYFVPHTYFSASLTLLATYSNVPPERKRIHLETVDKHQKYMKAFAERCEPNALHKYLLVEAEKSRILDGSMEETVDLYTRAIQSAHDHGFLLNEAIGTELLGEFWLSKGLEKVAYWYLAEASYLYKRWGSKVKVQQLKEAYPKLTTDLDESDTKQTRSSTHEPITNNALDITGNLDLSSIIKASQTLSGEIKLGPLISKLMHIVMENAGAQRAILILSRFGEWFIDAVSTIDENKGRALQSKRVSDLPDDATPKSVINYIIRTQEVVVLNNASEEGNFTEDPHIKKYKAKSLLGLPIINQGKLIGILGLQNFQVTGVFTPDRLEVLRTITAQVAISLENARLYENLEHLVKERTQKLSQTLGDLQEIQGELIEAKERAEIAREAAETAKEEAEVAREAAETANKAKSTFLANMSHELRTPLNAILGFSELMRREALRGIYNLAKPQQENLGLIYRSGEHLLTLIDNVLDLSKIEAGKATLNVVAFDLHHLLDDLVDMFHLKVNEKRLQMLLDCNPQVPTRISTDEVKLKQVLLNLLSNALKFTRQGRIIIRVSCVNEARNRLHFEVEDTGLGIAEDELETLFVAFTQTATGRNTNEGTGLGLAISREFVALMGGQLEVRSEVDKGTVFFFDIDVELAQQAAINADVSTKHVISLKPDQPTYRILIVDDNEANRQLLIHLLQPLGFVLKEASHGQEAVAIWRAWQPQLIWMDMRMPVMDGFTATKAIRSAPNGQETKIIALTASTLEEDKAEVLAAGCDDYYRKPFKEEDILEAMHHHLGVEFMYQTAEQSASNITSVDTLTADALNAIPTALLTSLETLSIQGNMLAVNKLIDQIRTHDERVAQALTELAEGFKYAEIAKIIRAQRQ